LRCVAFRHDFVLFLGSSEFGLLTGPLSI
jgi:hypothetical protein